MGMTHSTSGKQGFVLFWKYSECAIPRDDMIKILKLEEEFRFSKEYQDRYTACGDDIDQIAAITKELQLRALRENGYTHPDAIKTLNNMRKDYMNDDEVRNLAVYHRADMCFNWKGNRNGSAAPDVKVHDLEGNLVGIHEMLNSSEKPEVERINEYARQFADVANFAAIYLAEAHASDIWPLGSTICVNNHKTLAERIDTAKRELVQNRGCEIPVYVDTMENGFNAEYDAWPERFFILGKKTPTPEQPSFPIFEHIAMPSDQDRGFDRTEIATTLKAMVWYLERVSAETAKLSSNGVSTA